MTERAYNRYNSRRKALRKRRIAREVYGCDCYDNLHQYGDNKIHCSDGYCCKKTNNKTKRNVPGNYAPSMNYKKNELWKLLSMLLDEDEE